MLLSSRLQLMVGNKNSIFIGIYIVARLEIASCEVYWYVPKSKISFRAFQWERIERFHSQWHLLYILRVSYATVNNDSLNDTSRGIL